jgi:hypothetical protein
MKTIENQVESRSMGHELGVGSAFSTGARALRQGWWLVALVIVLVATLSLAEYILGPHTYRVEQSLSIVVTPIGASSTYDNYQASVWEETIGHALAEGRLTTVIGGFDESINAQLAADPASTSPHNLSQSQFQQDLAWSNSGNSVVLTAYWTTGEGAVALLHATIAALLAGDLTHVTIWRGALPANLEARIMTAGPATAPELDPRQQAAAQQLLLARLLLSLPAGLLLLFGWQWLRSWVGRRSARS